MAEKIVIASLDIDINSLIKSTADLKAEIDKLKNSQKELIKNSDTSSQQFIQNTADLKVLNSAYNQNIKVIAESTQATVEQENKLNLLNLALDTEVTNINQAREQIKILTKIRNESNVATEEGKIELEKINKKLDENNDFIKQNVSGLEQQKMNVGNYTNSIKDALSNLNPLNGGLFGFIERSKEAGGTGNLFKNSLKEVAVGFGGLTKASLTFIATPIGAVLAVLVGAFALIKNALDRSSDATTKLSKITGAFSGVMNFLLKALQPIGEFLIDGIVAGFEIAVKTIEKSLKTVSTAMKFLGLNEASKGLDNLKNDFKNAAESGIRLSKAEKELENAQRNSRLTQLEYQKQAEKIRQIRDDETKSTKERINANEKLGKVLKDQLKDELEIANTALKVANLRLQEKGKTKETLDAQKQALTEIADIKERITGQESEQLVNRNSLLKEANDKAKEFAEKQKARAEEQKQAQIKRNEELVANLELEKKIFEEKNKSENDSLTKRQKLYEKDLEILDTKLAKKLISEKEYEYEKLKIDNEFKDFKTKKEEEELNRTATFNQRKKELEDQIRLQREKDDIKREELKVQQDFEKKALELEKLQLDETQKTELLKLLETERGIVLQEIKDKFLTENLAKQKAVGEAILNNKMQQAQQEIAIVKQVTGMLTGLLGDSLGAQLAGIAIQAGIEAGLIKISTASAIAKNYANAVASAPPPFNTPFIIQAGVQNTALAVKSASAISGILSSAALSGLGAVLKNKGYSEGGFTGFGAKNEPAGIVHKGEVVFSQADVRMLGGANIVNALRPTSGYANGGIVAKNTSGKIENNLLEIIRNMPSPIVTVEDINKVNNRVNVIENNARF